MTHRDEWWQPLGGAPVVELERLPDESYPDFAKRRKAARRAANKAAWAERSVIGKAEAKPKLTPAERKARKADWHKRRAEMFAQLKAEGRI